MVRSIGARAPLGGRFPVLAVFSLLGLAVVICTVALLGLQPWEPEESVPRLEPPRVEAGVSDSVALPAVAPAVAVVEAAVAPGTAKFVSQAAATPNQGEGRETPPAVGPARAVAVSAGEAAPAPAPVPSPAGPAPESPAVTTPAPELASVPTPPAEAPEAKAPGGPVSAGGPGPGPGFEGEEEGEAEVCAGDEYVLTITLPEVEGEAVVILLEHIVADGSVETLELEGDLADARSLVLQLSSEGGCVEVQVDEGDAPESPAAVPAVG